MTDQLKSAIICSSKDIKINPEESKDNFGDELFENLIINFVEKDYDEKKSMIEEAIKSKDAKKLYFVVHSFKTTARMLCIEHFAQECQEIQDYSHVGKENWIKLEELLPLFMKDFESVYQDAKEIYNKDYKPKEVEILPEFNRSPTFLPQTKIEDNIESKSSSKIVLPCKNFIRLNSFGSPKNAENDEQKKETQINSESESNNIRPPKKKNSEIADVVMELRDANKIYNQGTDIPSFSNNLNTIQKSNVIIKKINTKSMRSLENLQTSQQFFSNNKSDVTNQQEKTTERQILNEMSPTLDSDMSETPRVLKEELSPNRFDNLVNNHSVSKTTGANQQKSNSLNIMRDGVRSEVCRINNQVLGSNQNPVIFGSTASSGSFINPTVSPTLAKRKLPIGASKTTNINMKIDEDVLFAELKPLKFDGLFKKEFSREELDEELKKIEAFNQDRESTNNKKAVGSSRSLKTGFANDNIMTDNAYPFIQESFKFNCSVL